jgi:hypothetical protein
MKPSKVNYKEKVRYVKKLLRRGINLGKLKYKNREELHQRG